MTVNKKHKQRVRERMARDGVTYSEALRCLKAERPRPSPPPTVTLTDGTRVTLHSPETAKR